MNHTMTQNERKTKPFAEVLGNRNFRLLWLAQIVSELGFVPVK